MVKKLIKQIYLVRSSRIYKTIIKKYINHDLKVKDLLLLNKKYKNVHCGCRCFILGNGPSLKTVNFSLLKNEYVFTVNQIARTKEFCKLKSNYHFWADPSFFKLDINRPEDKELLDTMKKINTEDNKPVCFFPANQIDFVNKYELNKYLDVSYFLSYGSLSEYIDYGIELDYTSTVPGFGTVVQWCITAAIYMGFSEIYLLGCDNSGLMGTMKTLLEESNDNSHVYSTSINEEIRKKRVFNSFKFEDHVSCYYNTIISYRLLFEYCSKNNIRLINCSSNTLIDSIPRASIEDILNNTY